MSRNKGQAALEFLTTYGWALLVILVMIGALVYFGLLNPSRALPNRCDAPPGFVCRDFQITETGFNVLIQNKQGEAIKNVVLKSEPRSDFINAPATGTCLPNVAIGGVAVDDQFSVNCTVGAPSPATTGMYAGLKGTKVKIELEVSYVPQRGTYNQTASFTVFGPVQ
jgi:hypothetical protein